MDKQILKPNDLEKIDDYVRTLKEINETPEQYIVRVRKNKNKKEKEPEELEEKNHQKKIGAYTD